MKTTKELEQIIIKNYLFDLSIADIEKIRRYIRIRYYARCITLRDIITAALEYIPGDIDDIIDDFNLAIGKY